MAAITDVGGQTSFALNDSHEADCGAARARDKVLSVDIVHDAVLGSILERKTEGTG